MAQLKKNKLNKDLLGTTRLYESLRVKVNNKPNTRYLFCVTAKNSKPGDNEIFFPIFNQCYVYPAYRIHGHIYQNRNVPATVELTILSAQ